VLALVAKILVVLFGKEIQDNQARTVRRTNLPNSKAEHELGHFIGIEGYRFPDAVQP